MFALFHRPIHPSLLTMLVACGLAIWGNAPLWLKLWQLPEVSGLQGAAFIACFMLMIAAAIHALLSLLNWRWLIKPAAVLLLLMAAPAAHFMSSYGIVIDPTMMVNVLQTDVKESSDLLTPRFFLAMLGLGLMPAIWVMGVKLKPLGPWKRTGINLLSFLISLAVMFGAIAAMYKDFSSVMRSHTSLRYMINPLNLLYGMGRVVAGPVKLSGQPMQPVGRDATWAPVSQERPFMIVVVIGETARHGHLGINGYSRDTTPELAKASVHSQAAVEACGTSTAAALPCMFSHLGREAYDQRTAPYESLLDVLHHAGLAVLWIDNQSGCKGLCDRVPNILTQRGNSDHELCKQGECFDEIMLEALKTQWQQLEAPRRAKGTVVFMHQMGSHGPAYFKRSPQHIKRFLPECKQSALQQCSREEIVNAYDNSIVYTDHFLGQVMQYLGQNDGPTAMIYISDHGESLGENGIYLHGLPFAIAPDVQKQVPWVTWLSPAWQKSQGLTHDCLKERPQTAVKHDHFFHSVLGLAAVKTSAYRPELDVYRPCQRGASAGADRAGMI